MNLFQVSTCFLDTCKMGAVHAPKAHSHNVHRAQECNAAIEVSRWAGLGKEGKLGKNDCVPGISHVHTVEDPNSMYCIANCDRTE